ncbi:uncharacterized protein [Ptychodera flava]|uniref:uncharacterized protein n=1 Tax=Ptychodera flava TaxID=63121 RepID=UPI00396A15DB
MMSGQASCVNVLALLPTWKDRFNLDLEKLSIPDGLKLFEAVNPSPARGPGTKSSTTFCFTEYLEHCADMIERYSIDFLLSCRDDTSVVKAALCDKFPHIPGPTLEAMMLCHNKYLTRKYADPDPHPIKFTHLDLDDFTLNDLEEALQNVGCPAIMKPCVATSSRGVIKVNCLQDMVTQMNLYKKFPVSGLCEFLKGKISHRKYPEAFKNGVIVEEYVDAAAIVGVEGLIANKRIIPWQVCDVFVWKNRPGCVKASLLPSTLGADVIEKVKIKFRDIAERMISHGYNNDFLAMDIFILKNGHCKLIEINQRMYCTFINLDNQCYTNGNPVRALLDLAQSKPIQRPIKVKYGLNAFITTYNKQPTRLSDLLELNDPSTKYLFTPYFSPDEEVAVPSDDTGIIIAVADFISPRHEDLLPAFYSLCDKVIKKPEWSPSGGTNACNETSS